MWTLAVGGEYKKILGPQNPGGPPPYQLFLRESRRLHPTTQGAKKTLLSYNRQERFPPISFSLFGHLLNSTFGEVLFVSCIRTVEPHKLRIMKFIQIIENPLITSFIKDIPTKNVIFFTISITKSQTLVWARLFLFT